MKNSTGAWAKWRHHAARGGSALAIAGLAACSTIPESQAASFYLSAQDGRAGLVEGHKVVRDARDSLAVVKLDAGHLSIVQSIDVPASLIGPPNAIAISPDGTMALLTASTRRDPSDPHNVVPYDLVSVIALDKNSASPLRVVGSLHTGAGAEGVSINRAGTLALVANHAEGSVSLLSIKSHTVTAISKLMLGSHASPAHVAFTPDGRHALVTQDGDNRISLLDVDGDAVRLNKKAFHAGLRPAGLDISPDGKLAVVSNLGGSEGDADTISLIDIGAAAPRIIDTVTVGQTPEGVMFSPDGKTVGVTVIDGSNKGRASPYYGEARYRLFRIRDKQLIAASEVKGGQWLQGQAFAPDSAAVLVQDAANRQIRLYRNRDGAWSDTGERLHFDAAPSTLISWY